MMARILITIPHFFNPRAKAAHGSSQSPARSRLFGLSKAISAFHQLYGPQQAMIVIDKARRQAIPANQDTSAQHYIDIVLCTTGQQHLVAELPDFKLFQHHNTQAEPMMLGFECHAVLKNALGQYDYYGYLEDDLVLADPMFFKKLSRFNQLLRPQYGCLPVLLPNRYEVTTPEVSGLPVQKVYIDGDLKPGVTRPFQDVSVESVLRATVLGQPVGFHRPLNPHSGCFFLTDEQLAHWAVQPHFLNRDTRFVGPLESAATLGLMQTFRVYKPMPAYANFFEIWHHDTRFIRLVGTPDVPLASS